MIKSTQPYSDVVLHNLEFGEGSCENVSYLYAEPEPAQ